MRKIKSRGIRRMVKNLITGIAGFVASHLANYLLEKGETVYGTYRWNEDLSRIQHIKDKITMIPADLLDLKSMIDAVATAKPDYIFHLAAQSYVPDSFKYPELTIQTNTIGTYNLLEAVRYLREITEAVIEETVKEVRAITFIKQTVKFDPVIHICSSSEVYGQVDKKDIPIKETQAFNPANPYAVGKIGADMLGLLYFKNYGLKVIRTRMFTHSGPRRTMMSAEVNFARQIALIEKDTKDPKNKGDYIINHGNLDSIRTWSDVRDAVRAYWLLVRKCTPGEVYNIGGNTQKTIGEMLDYLISLSPVKEFIYKEQDPSLLRPSDVTLQIPDTSKFIKATGWKPEHTFEQTMQDLLDWWRENV